MTSALKRVLAASALALAFTPAAAQEETGADKLVATINGARVTLGDLAQANEALGQQLQQVPDQFRPRILLDVLFERKLLADEAREAGVQDLAAFKARVANLTEEALRDVYIAEVMGKAITEDEIAARYDEEIGKLPKTEEFRARHILVKTEDEAKEVAEEARGGADFAELAKSKSTGPSGPNGGDLGYFTADRMVPEFSEAAGKLEPGGISDPVKTQFGWHVIKLEDKRDKAPPPIEAVAPQLRGVILREKANARVKALKDAATITYAEGMEPAPLPTPQGAGAAGAAAPDAAGGEKSAN